MKTRVRAQVDSLSEHLNLRLTKLEAKLVKKTPDLELVGDPSLPPNVGDLNVSPTETEAKVLKQAAAPKKDEKLEKVGQDQKRIKEKEKAKDSDLQRILVELAQFKEEVALHLCMSSCKAACTNKDCGNRLQPDAKFCCQCGKTVQAPCPCGAQLPPGAKFCHRCGDGCL
mmetsp:Transcript_68646/g.193802  ORF Transcript_68646/g.193802 Transcript_68646/m.193802 type:complete len:170 (+) Transcript_68646:242-751(+)